MATGTIDDRWFSEDPDTGERTVPTARHGKGARYRARYRDDAGSFHSKTFPHKKKREAQRWLAAQVTAVSDGTHISPATAKMTVSQWTAKWLEGYAVNRASTVRQARSHVRHIDAAFGDRRLSSIKPTDVKRWVAKLQESHKPSTVYAIYRRFAQIMGDAVDDGLIGKSPCSRKTAPSQGAQKPYVASTKQVWALHDAMPEHLRVAVLLGAFAGLRLSEATGLRVADVDYMRALVSPEVQHGGAELKTEESKKPVPIPADLALMLSHNHETYGGPTVVTNEAGRESSPWAVQRAVRDARETVEGLPGSFSFHDLRHYFASLLIAQGCDVKTVQARLRHASAKTTLDTYSHLWPDADETTRNAVSSALRVVPNVSPSCPQKDVN